MIEVSPKDVEPLILLRQFLMLYTLVQKTKTSLIQLSTDHIEQIKKDLINSPNKELIDKLISEYLYPRNFDLEPDVDESIYEIDSFIYDPRFYP